MKKLARILFGFIILRGVACVVDTEKKKNFNGKCQLYVVENLCIVDSCEDTQLYCEDDEGDLFSVRGINSSDIHSMVNEGTLESGISVYYPNQNEKATFDGESLQMNFSNNFVFNNAETSRPGNFAFSQTTGDNKLLLVIIDALDEKVFYSSKQLSSDVFGSGDPNLKDEVNVNSIFRACSNDQLRIYPGVEAKMDAPGTVRVRINMNLDGSSDNAILNAARAAAEMKLGITLPGSYQNVYYVKRGCYPKECDYAALASVGGYWSIYQGRYAQYSSIHAHEHGHNLGLYHSGEGTKVNDDGIRIPDNYGDHSCTMGNPIYSDENSRMCFNPAKSWMLNWYPGAYDEINPDRQPAYYQRLIGAGEWTSCTQGVVSLKIEIGNEDEDFTLDLIVTGMLQIEIMWNLAMR